MARGIFPGTFNPLTVAHLAIAETVVRGLGLERLDLAVSRSPLGKGDVTRPCLSDRVRVLHDACATRPHLGVVVRDEQLIAEIADGYDVLVVGRDKWEQMLDSAWYGSAEARDECLLRLPNVVVIPRDDASVSSTGARRGRVEWMAEEARRFDEQTGAWSDRARYDAWTAAVSAGAGSGSAAG